MNTRNLRFRSNRVRDIISLFHEELDGIYGAGEVGVFVEMLFEAFLWWDKVRLLTSREQTIDQSDLLRFHWALEDLKQYRPIQHIIAADVTAVDVSPKALEMARQNAKNNGVEVCFMERDVLNGVDGLSGSYGLIVSNPPYVMEKERAQMAANVLDYDPALALFVPDDDPLRFYKAIATIAKGHLAENGQVVVEINEDLAEETCAVFKAQGFTSRVHEDFRGKPRWISADGAGARRGE